MARSGPLGPVILRRGRGYAPGAVGALPAGRPVLALGADLKNAVTLVVDGQAFVSQHIGDLEHYEPFRAFRETIRDLLAMYAVAGRRAARGPRRASRSIARPRLPRSSARPSDAVVQHHRAHIASVLAERGAWDRRVLGVSFDGTGYGDDGAIWGGEIFAGSVREGFERVAHLRQAALVGGDAAARHPVQAAAGFLDQVDGLPDLTAAPFDFPRRYAERAGWCGSRIRVFATTSVGRLFDAAAALVGFTGPVSFEGQAAIWLEQLARRRRGGGAYPFPFDGAGARLPSAAARGRPRPGGGAIASEIARAFHAGWRRGSARRAVTLCRRARGGHGGRVGRRLPEPTAARRPRRAPRARSRYPLDQSRRAAERRRHQPGTGGSALGHARALDSRQPGGDRRGGGRAAGRPGVRGSLPARRAERRGQGGAARRPTRWRAPTRRSRALAWSSRRCRWWCTVRAATRSGRSIPCSCSAAPSAARRRRTYARARRWNWSRWRSKNESRAARGRGAEKRAQAERPGGARAARTGSARPACSSSTSCRVRGRARPRSSSGP